MLWESLKAQRVECISPITRPGILAASQSCRSINLLLLSEVRHLEGPFALFSICGFTMPSWRLSSQHPSLTSPPAGSVAVRNKVDFLTHGSAGGTFAPPVGNTAEEKCRSMLIRYAFPHPMCPLGLVDDDVRFNLLVSWLADAHTPLDPRHTFARSRPTTEYARHFAPVPTRAVVSLGSTA